MVTSLDVDGLERSRCDRTSGRRPRSGSANPKSRWLTEPEVRPAAGWSKVFLRRCFLDRLPEPLGDAAHIDINGTTRRNHDRQFCGQAAALSRRLDRRTCGERHGERSGGFGREGRSPGCHLRARSRTANAGAGGGSSRHGRGRARRGSHASRAATPKLSNTARRTRCTSPPRASAACCMDVTIDPHGRCVPATRFCFPGPIGDHGITILLARGELDLEADLRSDTRSVLPLVEALVRGRRPGRSLDARSNPRRRRYILQRTGARLRTGNVPLRRSDSGARCGARRMRVAGPGSAAHRQ